MDVSFPDAEAPASPPVDVWDVYASKAGAPNSSSEDLLSLYVAAQIERDRVHGEELAQSHADLDAALLRHGVALRVTKLIVEAARDWFPPGHIVTCAAHLLPLTAATREGASIVLHIRPRLAESLAVSDFCAVDTLRALGNAALFHSGFVTHGLLRSAMLAYLTSKEYDIVRAVARLMRACVHHREPIVLLCQQSPSTISTFLQHAWDDHPKGRTRIRRMATVFLGCAVVHSLPLFVVPGVPGFDVGSTPDGEQDPDE